MIRAGDHARIDARRHGGPTKYERADESIYSILSSHDVRDAEFSMTVPVLRFAPSPNGYLHLGHALSALANFDLARSMGGRFLLRLEDIDHTRCRAPTDD